MNFEDIEHLVKAHPDFAGTAHSGEDYKHKPAANAWVKTHFMLWAVWSAQGCTTGPVYKLFLKDFCDNYYERTR
jgi:hypothetical protein